MRPLNLLSLRLILPALVEKTPVPDAPIEPGAAGCIYDRSLVDSKKENLVADDGAAEGAPKLVLVVSPAAVHIEIILCVQIGVAQKFESVAVPLVGARLR